MKRALLLALCLLVLFMSSAAHAQQDRFSRGLAAYQRGDYQTAATEWNAAYAADPQPRLLFNIAQAYLRLGRLTDARVSFERFLASSPDDAESIAETRANLAAIRERLAHTGIRIRCAVEGASIIIDDVEWGRTPRPDPINVDPGVRRVVVRAPDGSAFSASIGVREGAVENVDAVLSATEVAATIPSVSTTTTSDAATTAAPEARATTGSHRVPVVPIVLMAAGGASTVAGIVLGALAKSSADDAATSDGSDASSAQSLALGSDIALFGGLGIAATGLVLFFVMPDDADEPSSSSIMPALGPGFAGATWAGSF